MLPRKWLRRWRRRGGMPQDLMVLSLADFWQLATAGRAIILAQGSIDRAATPLAGHGACQLNGAPVVFARYDQQTGGWNTNPNCFRLPVYLKDRNARALWSAGEWMRHKNRLDRHGALFGSVSHIRSRCDGRDDRARATGQR